MTLSLLDPRVREIKKEYDQVPKGQQRKKASFVELWFAFQGPGCFREVGLQTGITRNRAHQVYHQYFKEFFPRRRVISLARRKQMQWAGEVKRNPFLLDVDLGLVVRSAQEAGVDCELVSRKQPNKFKKRAVKIGGCLCIISVTKKSFAAQDCGSMYARWSVTAANIHRTTVHILVQNIEGFPWKVLVVPSVTLLECLGDRQQMTIYIPVYSDSDRKHMKVGWSKYEDRWDLLRNC